MIAGASKISSALRLGIAGWSVPKRHKAGGGSGSHLQRYAERFNAVEINSSFYKPHRRQTYERWQSEVPASFRFSAKVERVITHELKLRNCESQLRDFAGRIAGLGDKLAVVLVQLPPSLAFEMRICRHFFALLRSLTAARIVCEPRHLSWFEEPAQFELRRSGVARALAHPAIVDAAFEPGADLDFLYVRLHGAPRMYYSSYDSAFLLPLANRLRVWMHGGSQCWCIFDNTAESAAWDNALSLEAFLAGTDT